MKYALVACAVVFATSAAFAATPKKISVPSDPRASYYVLDVKKTGRNMVEITTKRQRKASVSYSKRLVDCAGGNFKYLGDGDTLDEMRRSKPSPKMGPLVRGSISYHISAYACRAAR